VLETAKRYDGYTAYQYLEEGIDHPARTWAEQTGRVPAYTGLDPTRHQVERTERLLREEIVISLARPSPGLPGRHGGAARPHPDRP
jgi:membrane dipeptidase